eukprot:2688323-Amphidinium_carterae.1
MAFSAMVLASIGAMLSLTVSHHYFPMFDIPGIVDLVDYDVSISVLHMLVDNCAEFAPSLSSFFHDNVASGACVA